MNKKPDEKPAFICIPVRDRDADLVPHTGVEEMNDQFSKGYLFLYERLFGINERYFFFKRIDL